MFGEREMILKYSPKSQFSLFYKKTVHNDVVKTFVKKGLGTLYDLVPSLSMFLYEKVFVGNTLSATIYLYCPNH